jgi:hypothetical protein
MIPQGVVQQKDLVLGLEALARGVGQRTRVGAVGLVSVDAAQFRTEDERDTLLAADGEVDAIGGVPVMG